MHKKSSASAIRLLDNHPFGIGLANARGEWFDSNTTLASLLNLDYKNGSNLFDIISESSDDNLLEKIKAVLSGAESHCAIELQLLNNERKTLWYELTISPLENNSPNDPCFFVILQDIETTKDERLRYEDLTNNIPGVIFQYILRPDGSDAIVNMSNGCNELFEIPAEQAEEDVGIIWSMIYEEDISKLQQSVENSANDLSFWVIEYRIITPSGKLKWLSGKGIPRRLKDGSIFWNSVLMDVTTQRENLIVLEHFFEQEFNLNSIVSLDRNFVRVNKLWEKVLGYSREELEGSCFEDYLHPDDLQMTRDEAARVFDNGISSFKFENRYRHKDGSYRWLSWSSLISEKENLVYATASDITDVKKAEEKLRQAATVFNSTADSVIITDNDHNIIDINHACEVITGFSKGELKGKHISFLRSSKNHDDLYDQIDHSLGQKKRWKGEIWCKRNNGEDFPGLLTVSVIKSEDDEVTGFVRVFSDITEIKQHQNHLDKLAYSDALTGLPNKAYVDKYFSDELKHIEPDQESIALLFIDADRFKHINDSLGHAAGDAVILQMSERLKNTVRRSDLVSRISGDEFIIVLRGMSDTDQIAHVADQILGMFDKPFKVNDVEVRTTVSIGISIFPNDATDVETLLANADAAMYRAKAEGRNNFLFHSLEYKKEALEYVNLANSLQNALSSNEFYLVYQPQINLTDEKVTGIEALIRWEHPDKGLISPERFIPVAEQSGLIRRIGAWVLNQACEEAKQLLNRGVDFGRVSVNVAGSQFYQEGFVEEVVNTLEQAELDPKYLELEVTETFLMHYIEKAVPKLQSLREMGVSIAIDDFGLGYSSMSYLKRLPIDKLKIDKSFVKDIPDMPKDKAIVDSMLTLGHALKLDIIAEGIETREQAEYFKKHQCYAQGFLFYKPASIDKLF